MRDVKEGKAVEPEYVACYMRVFSDEPRRNQLFDKQKRNLHQFASSRGWKIVKDICDNSSDPHPDVGAGLAALLEAARRQEFSKVLIESPHILGDYPGLPSIYIGELRSLGVEVISLEGSLSQDAQ